MSSIFFKHRFRYVPSLRLSILFLSCFNGLKSIVIKSVEPTALYKAEQGLLLTHGIIKGHSGELMVESEEGENGVHYSPANKKRCVASMYILITGFNPLIKN